MVKISCGSFISKLILVGIFAQVSLILFAECVYSEYLWKIIPAIEVSSGRDSTGHSGYNNYVKSVEPDSDTLHSVKPSFDLFYFPVKSLYINSRLSYEHQSYSSIKENDNSNQIADFYMTYDINKQITFGLNGVHEIYKVYEYDNLSYRSNRFNPSIHYYSGKSIFSISSNIYKREFEEPDIDGLKVFRENLLENEFVCKFVYSKTQSLGVGVGRVDNDTNFGRYDYSSNFISFSARIKILKKIRINLFSKQEYKEFKINPTVDELKLISIDETNINKRSDVENSIRLYIYSITSSWNKIFIDYYYINNNSTYDWEEFDRQIILFGIKFFYRIKKEHNFK